MRSRFSELTATSSFMARPDRASMMTRTSGASLASEVSLLLAVSRNQLRTASTDAMPGR